MVLVSCTKKVVSPGATQPGVILAYPTAAIPFNNLTGGMNYFDNALIVAPLKNGANGVASLNFSANIPTNATTNILVTIGVDTSQVSYYNSHPELQSDTTHQRLALMPDSCYSIASTTDTILSGGYQAVFNIQFYRKKIITTQTGYLLPISIVNASANAVNPNMKTIYFHIFKGQ